MRNISTFGALSDTTVVHLIRCGEVLALEPGEVLFDAGEPSECFYVILKGYLAFHKYHQGHYGFIRNYHFGENIGFVGMIALHRRIGRAAAVGDVIVVKISNPLFNELYESDTQEFALLLMNLSRDMARGIRALDNLIVERQPGTGELSEQQSDGTVEEVAADAGEGQAEVVLDAGCSGADRTQKVRCRPGSEAYHIRSSGI
ncbi:Crp/Fnr family transcriptional regulator [Marinobacterium rhizophilum]|uniref:Crp/Fnr family transcriptional regulator n=1 Tax=Marinobacterium rhizophilum TaxID=420402 RepID=A0ABY5HLW3_9GAMM|nr:Crp/Fnr family transcriptional regulator [Marinobacterium rhizophilum]UTW13381.1 Crp/Fnr family transcriptional regulator [Marinobacterium rhizophilum]